MPGGKKVRLAKEEDMVPALERAEVSRLQALHKWWKAAQAGQHLDDEDSFIDGPSTALPPKDGYTLSQVFSGLFFDGIFKVSCHRDASG